MKIQNIADRCHGCGACRNACPAQCIAMEPDAEGFLFPCIDQTRCTRCARCEAVCPALQPRQPPALPAAAYYGWHVNNDIRRRSSSGGAFTALCEILLARQSIIVGAVFDAARMRVCHRGSDTCDWQAMRKSKYVQSDIDEAFLQTKAHLAAGTPVLFSGTPCQIHGLRNFLGRDYEHLVTCDFICHGVPPMQLLNEHLEAAKRRYHASAVVNVDFRPKISGWSQPYIKVDFEQNRTLETPGMLDAYFQGFSSNLTLRRSCYSCPYTSVHASDITLADFWGIYAYRPSLNDERGISLLLINTEKGQQLVEAMQEQMHFYPLDLADAAYCLKPRESAHYSIEARDAFYHYYRQYGYDSAAKKFLHRGCTAFQVKQLVKKILGKDALLTKIT